jgi:hypothetical protein
LYLIFQWHRKIYHVSLSLAKYVVGKNLFLEFVVFSRFKKFHVLWLKLVRDSTQCFKSFFYCLPIFSLFSFFLFSLSLFLSILPSYLTLSCSFFQSTFSIFLSFLLSLFLPSYLTLSRSFFQSTFSLFVPFLFLSFFACVSLFHHYFQFGF